MLQINQLVLEANQQPLNQAFDWAVSKQQTWAVLGANGAGKTTLLLALAGLHGCYTGDISLNNNAIKDISQKQLAQSIGILLQDSSNAFPYVVQDLLLMARFPHQRSWSTLSDDEQILCQQLLTTFELTSLQDKSIDKLSGGERRRVELAMLAMQQPDIYLLDEPTNHLDIKHQIQALNYFCNLGKTIIMTLHDVNLVQKFCSHVLLFDHGRVITGTTSEVLSLPNLSSAFEQDFELLADRFFVPTI